VFHSHDLNTLYIGWKCAEKTGAKLVYDSHELATERNRMNNRWRKWAMWNERRGLPKADGLITGSPAWIPFLVERYGSVPRPAIDLINVPEYHEEVPVWDLRGLLDIPADVPVLLYQGSIQENRGIEQAIEATLMLDDAVLVVVGYGYHRPTLEAEVAKRGIGDRVKFFGPIPNHELLFWTAAADIGMANIINSSISYYTCLPNKLFEYMMAGVPVIGSDSPEIGRVVRETGVGIACDPADPVAIATAARTILEDKPRFVQATKVAATQYNWAVESRKLVELYEGLQDS
jgi:glycosyltransferase involved in cell wall biosynthesis